VRPSAALVLLLALLAAACATPVMPSGGPPDRTPPTLTGSLPAGDAVNVTAESLRLTFSKPIDEASLRRAISIAPDFETPPRVVVRGREAEVIFPEPLRENVTYVVTIGTELQDLRNNRLPAPITLAFATGPQLDEGVIEGWVRTPLAGAGAANVALFAYALPADDAAPPDPRVTAPDYRTETDTQGRFQFSYLREAPYFVVAVEDLNRNRRADPGERFGAPPEPAVRALPAGDTLASGDVAFYLARVDTLAPEPVRVRPGTDSRFAVRFTEPVLIADRDPAAFAVTDSASGAAVPIRTIYADADPLQVVVHTEPMAPVRHRFDVLRPEAVVDTAGNPLTPLALHFTPSTQPDDVLAQMEAFEPAGSDTLRVLRPGQPAAVRFTAPPLAPPAAERIEVVTAAGEPLETAVTTADGRRYTITPEAPGPFTVRVRQPDTTYVMRFTPMPADSLGDVLGSVVDAPAGVPVVVEATAAGAEAVRVLAGEDGSFALRNLPAGTVHLRIFADVDGSGTWDGGMLSPYRPPEPLRIVRDVRVRARWETELDPIPLDPAAAPPPAAPALPPDERPAGDPGDPRQPGTIPGGR
jgi:uncharacterized protein (DUF2141 family)